MIEKELRDYRVVEVEEEICLIFSIYLMVEVVEDNNNRDLKNIKE